MNAQILSLIMALCGSRNSCLSETVIIGPKTEKEAALTVRAVNARYEILNAGYNECGPYPGCFQAYIRDARAQYVFKCELKEKSKDCMTSFYNTKEFNKFKKEYDKENKK